MSAAADAIAFVVPHPYVDALACFREPIAALAAAGWTVDLYTSLSPLHPVPYFADDRVRIVPLEMTRAGAVRLVATLATRRPKYRWIVTVPQWGLHYAGKAAALAGIPMGCISDELFDSAAVTTPEQQRWKAREQRAHRKCRWTIALSEERAEFVRRDNALPPGHEIFIVPNAPPGPVERLTSHFYYDELGIPSDRRLLLHAGSLWWAPARALADAARSWRDGWVAVFQLRFAQQHELVESPQVKVSNRVLPAALLDYAVSSAAIGLALYGASGTRERLMGTASGKIARYMKNALPVIALEGPSFGWIEREGCGLCVSGVDDVAAAADRIWTEYESYVANVKRFYAASLDFRTTFHPVLERLAR